MIPREPDGLPAHGAREARAQATRARSLRSVAPPVSAAVRLRGRWPRLRAPWRRGTAAPGALARIITIDNGVIREAIGREVEEMPGDPIVKERLRALVERDCARRKLVAVLLPALDADGRQAVAELVEGWPDARTVAAGREVLADAWGGE
jgi:hypothetical protein